LLLLDARRVLYYAAACAACCARLLNQPFATSCSKQTLPYGFCCARGPGQHERFADTGAYWITAFLPFKRCVYCFLCGFCLSFSGYILTAVLHGCSVLARLRIYCWRVLRRRLRFAAVWFCAPASRLRGSFFTFSPYGTFLSLLLLLYRPFFLLRFKHLSPSAFSFFILFSFFSLVCRLFRVLLLPYGVLPSVACWYFSVSHRTWCSFLLLDVVSFAFLRMHHRRCAFVTTTCATTAFSPFLLRYRHYFLRFCRPSAAATAFHAIYLRVRFSSFLQFSTQPPSRATIRCSFCAGSPVVRFSPVLPRSFCGLCSAALFWHAPFMVRTFHRHFCFATIFLLPASTCRSAVLRSPGYTMGCSAIFCSFTAVLIPVCILSRRRLDAGRAYWALLLFTAFRRILRFLIAIACYHATNHLAATIAFSFCSAAFTASCCTGLCACLFVCTLLLFSFRSVSFFCAAFGVLRRYAFMVFCHGCACCIWFSFVMVLHLTTAAVWVHGLFATLRFGHFLLNHGSFMRLYNNADSMACTHSGFWFGAQVLLVDAFRQLSRCLFWFGRDAEEGLVYAHWFGASVQHAVRRLVHFHFLSCSSDKYYFFGAAGFAHHHSSLVLRTTCCQAAGRSRI
jgi:hypothetical protein